MTNDIIRLTKALRKDTPEQLLLEELMKRSAEIRLTLESGKEFKITDCCGRILTIRRTF